jgi:integrase/recombinase XerD
MKRQNVPEPQLISLVSGTKPTGSKPAVPTELRQQRVDEFLAARYLAPKSLKAYREDLARFMVWTDTAWSNITPRQVAQFKTHLLRNDFKTGKRILADASAKRILQTFKNFMGWMARSGYVDRDPTSEISLPKLMEPEANNLTDKQVQAILNAAMESSLPERNMALLSVLSHGLRAQEVSNLNIGDFDGQRLKIREAKADSKGTVPIDLDAQMWLQQYRQWREDKGDILTDESPPCSLPIPTAIKVSAWAITRSKS